ncbi:MAG: FtsX-like permease family protein [Pseudomonadota bacterium]
MRFAVFGLAFRSLLNRKGTALLTILAVALSTALFLGVEKTRAGARAGFEATISGTDLIVGARSSPINLLLYSVFRLGDATAQVSAASYRALDAREDVAWTVPISLGDSHRGYRVMGTTTDYFERYKYARGTSLAFADGAPFDDLFDAVIGAEVAEALDYELGSRLILTHGIGAAGLSDHDNRPFRVAGVLRPTGTPVDRTVHVSLEAITAIHVGWETGARNPLADSITEEQIRGFNLEARDVTAVFVGLKNRATVLRTKRAIDTDRREPLLAIIPGQTLAQLWQVTSVAERALVAVSIFVVAVGLVSILTAILTSLNERRREMSILRAVGAGPGEIGALLVLEAALLAFAGAVLGVAIVYGLLALLGPYLAANYGVVLQGVGVSTLDVATVAAVTGAALLMGLAPAIAAFRRSLADGLSVKL